MLPYLPKFKEANIAKEIYFDNNDIIDDSDLPF